MARLNPRALSSDPESDQDSASSHQRPLVTSETSPSPLASASSDKESTESSTRSSLRGEKRKPTVPATSSIAGPSSGIASKKRRLEDRPRVMPSQAAHRKELEERVDKQFYDPEQDEEERRRNKKGMRNLAKQLNDSRAEFLQSNSDGIVKTLNKADKLFRNVKQTSDATIDSRLLVTAADLSYKKIRELTLGDSATGVDVDDFVSKCIAFMKRGAQAQLPGGGPASAAPALTQTQRRRRREVGGEDGDEEGDAMDWDYLGRRACFLSNSRPCLSGFLLGPLSVQKKLRQATQRRAREARADPAQAARPITLQGKDLNLTESASLTEECAKVKKLLDRVSTEGQSKVEAEWVEEMTEEDLAELMRKNHVANNGGVPLFDFCVNPKSFGQTVENMFYVSFLIKEGDVGLEFDGDGMPTLMMAAKKSVEQRQETTRNQAVFTLDFDLWEDIIESCGIQQSIIPHRNEEQYDDGVVNGDGEGWHDSD